MHIAIRRTAAVTALVLASFSGATEIQAQQAPLELVMQFEPDDATLSPDLRRQLDEAVAALSSRDVHLIITGAKRPTAQPYGVGPGQRRAMAMRDYLIASGVAADNILSQSFGGPGGGPRTCDRPGPGAYICFLYGPGAGW